MHQVQLADEIYDQARRRAMEAGFASVDEYIAEVVRGDVATESSIEGDTPDLEHLFTPERLAIIDKAEAEIDAGNYYTAEEVREYFEKKRAEWVEKSKPR